jgi:protein-S-isoprenylcysteine O-methyltransferase Ste14
MKSADTVFPVASVLVIYLARMVELGARRDTISGPIRERWTLRLFMAAGTLMLIGSTAEFFVRRLSANWVLISAGWLCALASFGVRRRAIAALGKFWSLHVEIRENHQFVCSGPFRWVRHPTYFSMILELLSIALILGVLVTPLAVSLVFIPALALRVRLEESALIAKFGDAYRDYQRSTPALIPYKLIRFK